MRHLSKIVGLALVVIVSTSFGEEKRWNILWIVVEDMSPDFGCYGASDQFADTPNIDALAEQGVRFPNAFATSGACSPSRSALNTSMYQTSIGAQNHRTRPRIKLPNGIKSIPAIFRDGGYFVCRGSPNGSGSSMLRENGTPDWNVEPEEGVFEGVDWSERGAGQPFFAQALFEGSFRPWRRNMENPVDPSLVSFPPYYPDHPLTRLDWARYLEEIQRFDARVGELLDRLDREGLSKETAVFLFADHGRPFCRDTGLIYDGALRVPLIVRWPDGRRAGEVDQRLVSLVDIGPGSLKSAGLDLPDYLHGRPFFGEGATERQLVYAAKDRIGDVPDRVRVVRGHDFKYLRNYRPDQPYLPVNRYTLLTQPSLAATLIEGKRAPVGSFLHTFVGDSRPKEELYDLRVDPNEMNNLAQDPSYRWILGNFRDSLDHWVERYGDDGAELESEQHIQAYRTWLDGYIATILEKKGIDELSPEAMYAYWIEKYDL